MAEVEGYSGYGDRDTGRSHVDGVAAESRGLCISSVPGWLAEVDELKPQTWLFEVDVDPVRSRRWNNSLHRWCIGVQREGHALHSIAHICAKERPNRFRHLNRYLE